jgi:hypothetical protein
LGRHAGTGERVLYYAKRDLSKFLDAERVHYGEGRGEFGTCLHLPLKGYMAGSAPGEDHAIMLEVANNLIDYLLYKRPVKGPEAWDYDAEKASEVYTVCGDNPSSSGIIVADRHYAGGAKLQVFLDKTFGLNEVSIRWKNQLVGDEFLLHDYLDYLKVALVSGELTVEEST